MDWKHAKRKLLQDKGRREAYKKVDLSFEVGKMITDARIAKSMTQEKLAKLVGTKQPSIARIERGNTLPSLSFLQKIAKAFNTQLLPPRLEFLEKEQRTITVSSREAVDFSHRDVPELDWTLQADSDSLVWPNLERINLILDRRIQYAS